MRALGDLPYWAFRAWVRVVASTPGESVDLFTVRNLEVTNNFDLFVGAGDRRVPVGPLPGELGRAPGTVEPGRWYLVEARARSPPPTFTAEVRIDGVPQPSIASPGQPRAPCCEFMLGSIGTAKTNRVQFDDVRVEVGDHPLPFLGPTGDRTVTAGRPRGRTRRFPTRSSLPRLEPPRSGRRRYNPDVPGAATKDGWAAPPLSELIVRSHPEAGLHTVSGTTPAVVADLLSVRGAAGRFLVPGDSRATAARSLLSYNRLRPLRVRAVRAAMGWALRAGAAGSLSEPRRMVAPAGRPGPPRPPRGRARRVRGSCSPAPRRAAPASSPRCSSSSRPDGTLDRVRQDRLGPGHRST